MVYQGEHPSGLSGRFRVLLFLAGVLAPLGAWALFAAPALPADEPSASVPAAPSAPAATPGQESAPMLSTREAPARPALPPIDLAAPQAIETATFALG
ncbi:MAG: hypothetical protein HZA54_16400 [Planctomycetes bacterium]|nr:hypothetical protein [Planctomycetota bacterium]